MEQFNMGPKLIMNLSTTEIVVVKDGPIELVDLVILIFFFIVGLVMTAKRIFRRIKQLFNSDTR